MHVLITAAALLGSVRRLAKKTPPGSKYDVPAVVFSLGPLNPQRA
jgi:hypothetical protein